MDCLVGEYLDKFKFKESYIEQIVKQYKEVEQIIVLNKKINSNHVFQYYLKVLIF